MTYFLLRQIAYAPKTGKWTIEWAPNADEVRRLVCEDEAEPALYDAFGKLKPIIEHLCNWDDDKGFMVQVLGLKVDAEDEEIGYTVRFKSGLEVSLIGTLAIERPMTKPIDDLIPELSNAAQDYVAGKRLKQADMFDEEAA